VVWRLCSCVSNVRMETQDHKSHSRRDYDGAVRTRTQRREDQNWGAYSISVTPPCPERLPDSDPRLTILLAQPRAQGSALLCASTTPLP
jgi:hypothetical protein